MTDIDRLQALAALVPGLVEALSDMIDLFRLFVGKPEDVSQHDSRISYECALEILAQARAVIVDKSDAE